MRRLAILFFLVPLLEMYILIKVGGVIGALPTVLLVVFTAVLGVWLLHREGLATLNRLQAKLDRGEAPNTEMLEGLMLIVGGTLLLTPGFVTDTLGFIALLPSFRRPLARWLITIAGRHHSFSGGYVIEGEFVNEDKPSDEQLPPRDPRP